MIHNGRAQIQGVAFDCPTRGRQRLLKGSYVPPEGNLAVRRAAEVLAHDRRHPSHEQPPEVLRSLRVGDSIRPFLFASAVEELEKQFHSEVLCVTCVCCATCAIRPV